MGGGKGAGRAPGAEAITLLTSQRIAVDALKERLEAYPLLAFGGEPGCGRTTILRAFAAETGAAYISLADLAHILARTDWKGGQEALHAHIAAALANEAVVVIDDAHLMGFSERATAHVLFRTLFRPEWIDSVLAGKTRLVLAGNTTQFHGSDTYKNTTAGVFGQGTSSFDLAPLGGDDYREVISRAVGSAGDHLDINLIFRHAGFLNLYQLIMLGKLLKDEPSLSSVAVIELVEKHFGGGTVRIGEVEQLSFADLPGTEAIAEALEAHVILPFEKKEMAAELGLKASRGVLLYGPPGTGKTSIGRALAHRMKGRFFLLDGSFVTEPPRLFFAAVQGLVNAAKMAAPSVLFIDDADVLFQIEHIAGLSRYLLSLLDGLESETAGNVCIVMTAMDASKLPEALLRSGRVELWLETRAPDTERRMAILEKWMSADVAEFQSFDARAIAEETQGFTPADLRRLSGEAKLFYAADVLEAKPVRPPEDYLRRAIEEMVAQRDIMAQQLADETLRIRPYA